MHLSKNEDQHQRVIQTVEMDRVQTVFKAVQTKVQHLRLEEDELYGLSQKGGLDWKLLQKVLIDRSANFPSN